MRSNLVVLSLALSFLILTSYSFAAEKRTSRKSASLGDYESAQKAIGLNWYRANLHAHHYMAHIPGRKSNLSSTFLGPGPCQIGSQFPQDDGRPCRADSDGINSFVTPPEEFNNDPHRMFFFRTACEYAAQKGELDILFVTPHSKNNEGTEADTVKESYFQRHAALKSINESINEKTPFYCGLGQEMSSISKGNHINVFGQFPLNLQSSRPEFSKPIFFEAGDFQSAYSNMGLRIESGEKLIVQLNHPEVQRDLFWKPLTEAPSSGKSAKGLKEKLNDYGIDDFYPVSCLAYKLKFQGSSGASAHLPKDCERFKEAQLTNEQLKETFRRIREVSKDPFRLIEIVGTLGFRSVQEKYGATDNPYEEFLPVQLRSQPGFKEDRFGGLWDYIFYLNMGFKISPTANQDNHHMNWGSAIAARTGVLSKDLSEESVLEALQQRRTVASEDRNAKVLFWAESSNKVHPLGSVIANAKAVKMKVSYYDPDSDDQTALVRVYYYRQDDELDFSDRLSSDATHRFVRFESNGPRLPFKGISEPRNATRMRKRGRSVSAADSSWIEIKSAKTLEFDLPFENKPRYLFIELTQSQDQDKIWTAPIWLE
ncbi:MAG: hypothetical protein IT289_11290 [Oligoflexia bacterium]|nr:hypothetical protein [Oligoflexia bacterium]